MIFQMTYTALDRMPPEHVAHIRDEASRKLGKQVVDLLLKNPAVPMVMKIENDWCREPGPYGEIAKVYTWRLEANQVNVMNLNWVKPERAEPTYVGGREAWPQPPEKTTNHPIEMVRARLVEAARQGWKRFWAAREVYFADEWLRQCRKEGR